MEAKAAAQWPPWLLCLSTTLLLCTCSAAEEATALPSPTAAQGAVGQACAVFSGKTCDECIQNTSGGELSLIKLAPGYSLSVGAIAGKTVHGLLSWIKVPSKLQVML
uniref:Uncharacterized protein n=1 Tax=Sphaerodactylus townsendi TaxID=933632 RepID=A0ACB8FVK4_9SAUR